MSAYKKNAFIPIFILESILNAEMVFNVEVYFMLLFQSFGQLTEKLIFAISAKKHQITCQKSRN
jgi:hypothetical protein